MIVERHRTQRRRQHAGLELGDVENGLQQVLDRRQRVLDALGDAALMLVAVRLGERAGRQARGVQRLQQIVADGGEEACLETVGALGRIAGARQLVVGALQTGQRVGDLLGAHAHLAFERDRRLEQRIGVGLRVHRALDALHQGSIDLLQLVDAALQILWAGGLGWLVERGIQS